MSALASISGLGAMDSLQSVATTVQQHPYATAFSLVGLFGISLGARVAYQECNNSHLRRDLAALSKEHAHDMRILDAGERGLKALNEDLKLCETSIDDIAKRNGITKPKLGQIVQGKDPFFDDKRVQGEYESALASYHERLLSALGGDKQQIITKQLGKRAELMQLIEEQNGALSAYKLKSEHVSWRIRELRQQLSR